MMLWISSLRACMVLRMTWASFTSPSICWSYSAAASLAKLTIALTLTAAPTAMKAFFSPAAALFMALQERETLFCIPRMDCEALLACLVIALKSAPARTIKLRTAAISVLLCSAEELVQRQYLRVHLLIAHVFLDGVGREG